MSQYVNFYMRDPKTKRFLPIADYNRSTVVYEYCHESLPYEDVQQLTKEIVSMFIHDIEKEDNHYTEYIAKEKAKLDMIPKMEGVSVIERMEAIAEIQEVIEDYNDLHTRLMAGKAFFELLSDMIDAGRYVDGEINEVGYIYAGVEISEAKLNEHPEEVN